MKINMCSNLYKTQDYKIMGTNEEFTNFDNSREWGINYHFVFEKPIFAHHTDPSLPGDMHLVRLEKCGRRAPTKKTVKS